MNTLKGFKAFDADFTCRGYKFEVGKEYEIEGEIKLCGNGFHFCVNASDTLNYYTNPICFAEVEAIGKWITDGDKTVTSKIRIVREISRFELLELTNIGKDNTGFRNSGNENSGNENSGNRNSGDWNSGNRNSGNENSGDWNIGDWNSGDWNSGNRNSGNGNSGNMNSGNMNSGDWNSGNMNSGNRNSGNWNSGNWNSGNGNSGDWNSGNWNSGNRNSGIFNSNEPNIRMFNKETNYRTLFYHPALTLLNSNWYSNFSVYVNSIDMTNEEKKKFPSHETTGGYIRICNYKEAWKMMWDNFSKDQKNTFTTLPNFDYNIFEEITGIKKEDF